MFLSRTSYRFQRSTGSVGRNDENASGASLLSRNPSAKTIEAFLIAAPGRMENRACGTHFSFSSPSPASLRACCIRTPANASRETALMLENLILLGIAAALMIYLFVCLLRPEKF
jgi:K+-transporting ATPase KdpF subunit